MAFPETEIPNQVNKESCRFCVRKVPGELITENDLAYAFPDKYPVTPGHALIIPKRHFPDFFDITREELEAVFDLAGIIRQKLIQEDGGISGFNFGANSGTSAGQTIFHCHFHLIPRRDGDIDDPRGGVRGAIPSKRIY